MRHHHFVSSKPSLAEQHRDQLGAGAKERANRGHYSRKVGPHAGNENAVL
jgi:hypothetical protein